MSPNNYESGTALRILITNDDGIDAPGIWSVAEALQDLGEIAVVAPDRDQSGIGTARTLLEVVRAKEVPSRLEGAVAYSIQGTPADCVILAIETLFDETFDLVVSGINAGANLGLDVLASGTLGAAFHGYFRSIPSIAVSTASVRDPSYDVPAKFTRDLVDAMMLDDSPQALVYNVNTPNVTADKIEGVELTNLGPRAFLENVEKGEVGPRTHYWIRHNKPLKGDLAEGIDILAVRNNRISITLLDPAFLSGGERQDWTDVADKLSKRLNSHW
ncbi:MAG: 5'/3'-nucleotidase SurE [SAR202 cluster bacterium]|jgi:5'-nucleotidase|nr:5'/3'-nucleotidase SurE [Chloroflexota bacterium]MQG59314.1 5'/3'-nucleotidase SurE [SAR202 cluster bacterium]MQG69783.1 5'/3'-nucleotidase SurE [SAR202 cluster bacterium]HAL46508.1 5'/3'-nucleotidase SurE [Dehalococcoidia bacterium]|tara:strand:+ start:995 stop:1813 length:819 start_codon:yes stop_codon:yes gene_type:complete